MVKSVLGVSHQGLRDWIIQRVSAIYHGSLFHWIHCLSCFSSELVILPNGIACFRMHG